MVISTKTIFDWNQARAFLATAEEGSLSAAARVLGLTQPTLSRQVTGLEEALGVTLFERTPRALLLTQAGMDLLEHFRAMGEAADRISIAATGLSQSVTGHVVLSTTDMMAMHFLPPILRKLRTQAPGVTLEIITSNEQSDLRRREADIAIRHGRPQDENLIAKRLRGTTAHPYASKTYLAEVGRPSEAADLARMQFVGTDDPERLVGPLASLGVNVSRGNFPLIAASGMLTLELIRQDFGVGFLPREVGEHYPELENPWPQLKPLPVETWLVTHRELRTNPRIRLVFDVVSDGLSAP